MGNIVQEYYKYCRKDADRYIQNTGGGKKVSNPLASVPNKEEIEKRKILVINYLYQILEDFKQSFRHICASPNRSDAHAYGYAFPSLENLSGSFRENFELYEHNINYFISNLKDISYKQCIY